MAVVVPRPGVAVPTPRTSSSPGAAEQLGAAQVPAPGVQLVEALPMGPSKKVLKRELRRLLNES